MDKRKVNVSIKGVQKQDGETNDVELFTEGEFYKENSNYILRYEESEMTGLEGTTTTVEIAKDKVSLIRTGNVNNQMLFIKGKKTTSYYNTEYGSLYIGVMAEKLDVSVDDDGGELNINYILDINEEYLGENTFCISIKNA